MSDAFSHDVFLSHSGKDKAVTHFPSLSASTVCYPLRIGWGQGLGVRCRIPQRTTNLVAVDKHLPDVLKLPCPAEACAFSPRRRTPISRHGNVNEIIGKFDGADQLRTAVNQLQSLLCAA